MKRETSFFKFLRKTNTYLCVRGLTGLPTGSCLYGQNESSFVLNSFHFEQQLVDILHVQILSSKLITKRPQATLNFSLPLENLLSAIHERTEDDFTVSIASRSDFLSVVAERVNRCQRVSFSLVISS